MLRPGHLQFTLRAGERLSHVPSRLDHLAGNARPANLLDGGEIDRILDRYGGGGRCLSVYHAKRALGHPGERHTRYDDVEEAFGMSRTYQVQIAEPEHTLDVVRALRESSLVESSAAQTLATTQHEPSARPGLDAASLRMLATEPHRRIHADEALAVEPGDERITVAIVDTGIVIGHPEFQRKCLAGYNAVDIGIGRLNEHMRLVGDSRGRDYNPYDYVGHGCHVGGIIGAQGWRVPRGVAGRALLLPIRVLAAAVMDGSRKRIGVGALPDIDLGLKIACDLGADVINMSFGTARNHAEPDAPQPHAQVVDYLNHYGCVLVAAAGNSGVEEDYYPACLPPVVCVSSVARDGSRSRFSTWGRHVALCAPGESIVSAAPSGGYQINSGTSFAAPFVSAVAALMLGRAMRLGKALDAAAVRRLLIESASPLGAAGYNAETGHGLVDARAALAAVDRLLGSTR
ncbi:S8 family peptidase [Burkholderia ubonensis]|uniref:S8 family peptidase n=1 Tax=Burkholderia ubonensis TaxID=101571 RepID=UPI0007C7F206|nr:S8 family serine peptidase [Burkholderia ubonensis]